MYKINSHPERVSVLAETGKAGGRGRLLTGSVSGNRSAYLRKRKGLEKQGGPVSPLLLLAARLRMARACGQAQPPNNGISKATLNPACAAVHPLYPTPPVGPDRTRDIWSYPGEAQLRYACSCRLCQTQAAVSQCGQRGRNGSYPRHTLSCPFMGGRRNATETQLPLLAGSQLLVEITLNVEQDVQVHEVYCSL